MSALVTRAAGLVGSNLADHLTDLGGDVIGRTDGPKADAAHRRASRGVLERHVVG